MLATILTCSWKNASSRPKVSFMVLAAFWRPSVDAHRIRAALSMDDLRELGALGSDLHSRRSCARLLDQHEILRGVGLERRLGLGNRQRRRS